MNSQNSTLLGLWDTGSGAVALHFIIYEMADPDC
jgi:hypothetical protein